MVTHADITQKFKMVAVKPEIHACTFVHGIEIPKAHIMFSRMANSMALRIMLSDVSEIRKSKMAAVELEVHVSQLVVSIITLLLNKIATRSERL